MKVYYDHDCDVNLLKKKNIVILGNFGATVVYSLSFFYSVLLFVCIDCVLWGQSGLEMFLSWHFPVLVSHHLPCLCFFLIHDLISFLALLLNTAWLADEPPLVLMTLHPFLFFLDYHVARLRISE